MGSVTRLCLFGKVTAASCCLRSRAWFLAWDRRPFRKPPWREGHGVCRWSTLETGCSQDCCSLGSSLVLEGSQQLSCRKPEPVPEGFWLRRKRKQRLRGAPEKPAVCAHRGWLRRFRQIRSPPWSPGLCCHRGTIIKFFTPFQSTFLFGKSAAQSAARGLGLLHHEFLKPNWLSAPSSL